MRWPHVQHSPLYMESVPSNLCQISKQTYVTQSNDNNENRNEYTWCKLKLIRSSLEYNFSRWWNHWRPCWRVTNNDSRRSLKVFALRTAELTWIIKNVAIECDYFQIAVLMNWVEYKKHKKLRSISSKMSFKFAFYFLKITSLNWSPRHAIHYCNRDRKLTITV
jgi:hypothetical protein